MICRQKSLKIYESKKKEKKKIQRRLWSKLYIRWEMQQGNIREPPDIQVSVADWEFSVFKMSTLIHAGFHII